MFRVFNHADVAQGLHGAVRGARGAPRGPQRAPAELPGARSAAGGDQPGAGAADPGLGQEEYPAVPRLERPGEDHGGAEDSGNTGEVPLCPCQLMGTVMLRAQEGYYIPSGCV